MSNWPETLGEEDLLFVAVDLDSDDIKYLVLSSVEKGGLFMRDNNAWAEIEEEAVDDMEIIDVKLSIVSYYDKQEIAGNTLTVKDISRFVDKKDSSMLAAAPGECPPATQDIALNLANRENAIRSAGYGPLNPQLENTEFWKKKAERWTILPEEAKKSRCGNCAAFIVTSDMLECIAAGLKVGGGPARDAWSTIDAGSLGYCEAFDFKCAAARTCDAWITGGPVTDD